VTETVFAYDPTAVDLDLTVSRVTTSTTSPACSTETTQLASTPSTRHSVALLDRPEMFVADVGNGCLTPKNDAELKFPQPGVVVKGDGVYPLRLPMGNCSRPV
jgi:hypothetical protein